MALLLRLIGIGAGALGLLGCPLFALFGTPTAAEPPCPADKIAFEQARGCENDGSVEFCIPAGDPAALEAVRAIDPKISCIQGSMGRARCDLGREMLCLMDTLPYCGKDRYGAINDTGWARICAFARLPFVTRIVPTWYE